MILNTGKVRIDPKKCIVCGICREYCPTGAIIEASAGTDQGMHVQGYGIDEDACVECGNCVDICPVGAIIGLDSSGGYTGGTGNTGGDTGNTGGDDDQGSGGHTGNTGDKFSHTTISIKFHGFDTDDRKGCFRRCTEMLNSANYKPANSDDSRNKHMVKYDPKQGKNIISECKEGKELIESSIEDGAPVIVGVESKFGESCNSDGITDHWVVIMAKGHDDKGNFFRFYDPATGIENKGTADHLIFREQSDGTWTFSGKVNLSDKNYTITTVRKTLKK